MPAISTLAAVSAIGYGRHGARPGMKPDGRSSGLFYMSPSTTTTNKYNFASKAMRPGAALQYEVLHGAAAGNSDLCMGTGMSVPLMQKYLWATDATAVGPEVTPSVILGAATSNSTTALYHRGTGGNATAIYTYANDSLFGGTASWASGQDMSAAGNATRAYFKFGGVTTTNRYNYADATWVIGNGLSTEGVGGAACGVAEYAIFALGKMRTDTNRLTFATGQIVFGTSLPNPVGFGAAVGDDTSGLFATGADNLTQPQAATSEYIWASATAIQGTSLLAAAGYPCGASNGTTGVNVA